MPKIPRQLTDAQIPAGIEYIKAQLEYARDDSRQVYLRVTAALAVAGLVLTQLPFVRLKALELVPKWCWRLVSAPCWWPRYSITCT